MSTIGNQALPFDPSRSSGKPRDEMIWLIAFLTKNAAAIAIIGATAGAIQATEGAVLNAIAIEKEIKK